MISLFFLLDKQTEIALKHIKGGKKHKKKKKHGQTLTKSLITVIFQAILTLVATISAQFLITVTRNLFGSMLREAPRCVSHHTRGSRPLSPLCHAPRPLQSQRPHPPMTSWWIKGCWWWWWRMWPCQGNCYYGAVIEEQPTKAAVCTVSGERTRVIRYQEGQLVLAFVCISLIETDEKRPNWQSFSVWSPLVRLA